MCAGKPRKKQLVGSFVGACFCMCTRSRVYRPGYRYMSHVLHGASKCSLFSCYSLAVVSRKKKGGGSGKEKNIFFHNFCIADA